MGLARATRNLARTNPMWALLGVLLAPFRFARHIVGVVLFALVLFAGLFLLLMLSIWYFNDQDSAKLVSDLAGQETVVFETMQHVGRPLLTPDEVRTLRPDRQLLFLAGQRPIVAAKLRYYADREFAGRFDPA